MTDNRDAFESFRDWLVTVLAEIEKMGCDDEPPKRQKRATNGRFVKTQ